MWSWKLGHNWHEKNSRTASTRLPAGCAGLQLWVWMHAKPHTGSSISLCKHLAITTLYMASRASLSSYILILRITCTIEQWLCTDNVAKNVQNAVCTLIRFWILSSLCIRSLSVKGRMSSVKVVTMMLMTILDVFWVFASLCPPLLQLVSCMCSELCIWHGC